MRKRVKKMAHKIILKTHGTCRSVYITHSARVSVHIRVTDATFVGVVLLLYHPPHSITVSRMKYG